MLRNLSRFGFMNVLRRSSAFSGDGYFLKTMRTRKSISPLMKDSKVSINNNRLYSTSIHIKVDNNLETINIPFEDGPNVIFPFVWLRYNCRCDICFGHSSKQKITLLEDLDVDVYPIDTEIHASGQSVIVHWSDEHKSEYPMNWLRSAKFPSSMDPIDGPELKLWGSEMTRDKIPTFSFLDIMSDESPLYAWLESLHTYGISIVNDLGDDDKNLIRLANRVAYPKQTKFLPIRKI